MNHYENRITRAAARKLFTQEKPFIMVACNLRKEFGITVGMTGHDYNEIRENFNNDFDKLVNAFQYYNCNSETGRYSAFYLP